jgi:hypothetical protein
MAEDRIVCSQCGRSGPMKPALAGKKLRCKCGNLIMVPEFPAEEAQSEDLQDLEPLRPEPVQEGQAAHSGVDEGDEYDIRDAAPADNREVERPADVVAYQSARRAAPPEPPASAFPHFARPKTYGSDSSAEQSSLIRYAIILAVLAVLIGGSIAGMKFLGGHGGGSSAPMPGEDADIVAKMNDEYCKEIHAWFQEDNTRIMGPWSQSQALSQADKWSQMGAKQVLALGSRMSLVAVIELPDEAAKRKQLFDWQAQWHAEHMQRVWTDVGQKYLMIRLGV